MRHCALDNPSSSVSYSSHTYLSPLLSLLLLPFTSSLLRQVEDRRRHDGDHDMAETGLEDRKEEGRAWLFVLLPDTLDMALLGTIPIPVYLLAHCLFCLLSYHPAVACCVPSPFSFSGASYTLYMVWLPACKHFCLYSGQENGMEARKWKVCGQRHARLQHERTCLYLATHSYLPASSSDLCMPEQPCDTGLSKKHSLSPMLLSPSLVRHTDRQAPYLLYSPAFFPLPLSLPCERFHQLTSIPSLEYALPPFSPSQKRHTLRCMALCR